MLVTSCGTTNTSNFPPSADLKRVEESRFDPTLILSEAHHDDVQTRREARADRYDAQLERLCLFFKEKGMRIDCSAALDPQNPK